MVKNKALGLCLWVIGLFATVNAWGQSTNNKYFIEFKDKANTPFSISDPSDYLSARAIQRRENQHIAITERDLPVNPAYVQALRQVGAKVWYTSKWMNAALVEADSATLVAIKGLAFVKPPATNDWHRVARIYKGRKPSVQSVARPTKALTDIPNARINQLNYGYSASQITMLGADEMHQSGFTGKGMYVALFDSGFRNVNQMAGFSHLFTDNQILGTYDFVMNESSVFEDDSHGTSVLSTMAAYLPGELIGTAYEANYFLFRTEDAYSESRVEEINWLLAAEYADSVGVDVINASVGYNTFDDPKMNYRQADMDGNTALITRAADMAAATGMLVVTSAGNEGNDAWRIITAPADADSVLSVGAVDRNRKLAPFSSVGPSSSGRVKPNVAAQGSGVVVLKGDGNVSVSNGTSFSSPLMAGMVASFWQAYPQLTNMQVIDYLQRSASQFERPDSLQGYGIPNFKIAAQLAEADLQRMDSKVSIWPNPLSESGQTLTVWIHPDYIQNPIKVQFFDTRGSFIDEQIIPSPANRNQLTLNPSVFRSGMYVIRVSSSGLNHVSKILKL